MMVVGFGHLLGIAVEKPIDRSLGRHRLYKPCHDFVYILGDFSRL